MNRILAIRLSQLISANKSPSLRTVQSLLTASQQVAKGAQKVRVFISGSWVTLTAKMAVDEALKVLELSAIDARNTTKLKTAYRAASRKHHPDTGGDPEMMKKVNEAMEVLEKNADNFAGGRVASDGLTKEERNKMAEEISAKGEKIVLESIKDSFKPESFTAHFTKAVGKPFKYIEGLVDWRLAGDGVKQGYKNHAKWVSEDGETIFSLLLTVNYFKVKPAKSLGGNDEGNFVFDMETIQEIIHDGRKTKFKPRAWGMSSRSAVLMNPEEMFPTAKIKKMVGGADKKRKFSRRDMLLGIEKYLDGKVFSQGKNEYAWVPFGQPNRNPLWDNYSGTIREFGQDETILTMQRMPLSFRGERYAQWYMTSVAGPRIPKAGRQVAKIPSMAFDESDELMMALRKAKKACANLTDTAEIARIVTRHLMALKDGGPAEPDTPPAPKKPSPAPIDFGMWASVGPVVRDHVVHAMAAFEEARLLAAKLKP